MVALLAVLTLLGSSLDRELIKRAMAVQQPAFRACYEAAVTREGPSFAGKATLSIAVNEKGTVTATKVIFPIDSAEFTTCLHDAAMKVQFGPGPAPFSITWPIVFTAAK